MKQKRKHWSVAHRGVAIKSALHQISENVHAKLEKPKKCYFAENILVTPTLLCMHFDRPFGLPQSIDHRVQDDSRTAKIKYSNCMSDLKKAKSKATPPYRNNKVTYRS